MGAKIKGAGTDVIRITGGGKTAWMQLFDYPRPNRNGNLHAIAAAATRGDVTIKNVIPTHMEALRPN